MGHASDYDGITGCTVVICDAGAVGGVDVRGSATGSQELDVLHPGHVTGRIQAVVLAGGSAFGLEAASGVRKHLAAHGMGFQTAHGVVPLVPGAILYDLGIGKPVRPSREMGEAAAAAANAGPVQEGSVGAGTGATVGKLYGMSRATKAGLGSYTVDLPSGARVSALVVVNALGDVRDPASGKIVAGLRTSAGDGFANSESEILKGRRGGFTRSNTTLAVVATDRALTKVQATKLAQLAQLGMARTIYPVNTMSDGDIVFALSCGNAREDLDALGVAAAEAVAQAILRAVRLSKSLGGIRAANQSPL